MPNLETTEKDLGNSLFLRWSTIADKEKIAHLLGTAFREKADEPFDDSMADWISICTLDDFPFSGPKDWAIIEDRSKTDCPIIACTCLWTHQWSYAGIPFSVGRPEFVATDPAYRNRGLIRAIFGLLHERGEAKGHLLQGITGIRYFYRLFEYEYVLDLDGSRVVQTVQIPKKNGEESEPFSLRVATANDIPTLMKLYDEGQSKSLIWHEAPEAYWRLHVNMWNDPSRVKLDPKDVAFTRRLYAISTMDGEVCGFTLIPVQRFGKSIALRYLCLSHTVNVAHLAPSLLRSVQEIGEQLPCTKPDLPLSEIGLGFGRHHSVYDVLGPQVAQSKGNPYAWYIRVPDLPAFIRHIAPVLEERIANSMLIGHSGEVKIDFYRDGLSLNFEEGKLVQVQPWRPALYENGHAGFPPLTFLQLLLGYRSLAELRDIFPDAWANQEATLLLNVLFPKLPSVVHPLA